MRLKVRGPTVPPDEFDDPSFVARRLEEDIALGRIRPRQRLVEDELIVRFGAKRNAVRQALIELETMGVIERPRNKGAIVRDFNAKEVDDLYVVRQLLEGKATEIMPLPSPAHVIAELKQIHTQHEAAGHRGDLATVFRQNLRFHQVFFAACENQALAAAIELYQMKSHAIRSYSIANPDLLGRVTSDHAAMIDALENEDRPELIRLVAAHILPAKRAYLGMLAPAADR